MNSNADKLFVTVGVIVRRDDARGTVVKENDGGG
jgi:hypothetical protein